NPRGVVRAGDFSGVATSTVARRARAGVQRALFLGRSPSDRKAEASPSDPTARPRWVVLSERGTEGDRIAYGGVHRSSSVQVHRVLGTAAALLGSDRIGRTVGPEDG